LPGGRYTLNVSKAGYVAMSYGQRRPEQQGTVLEITDGTTVDKIAFALPRGGVITGNVLDEFGDPIAGAQVNASRFRYVAGTRRLTPAGGAQTDDRGAYRIYGLPPGEYYVSGMLRDSNFGAPGQTNQAPAQGYAPTYYPGTPNPSEASRVIVRAAQETTNISLALAPTRLARITGRAVNSAGAPVVQGIVILSSPDQQMMGMMSATAMTDASGAFVVSGLAAGNYVLTLRPRGMPAPDSEFALTRVTVGATDLDNLLLITSRGAVARGVIVTDEGTPLPAAPEQVQLFAQQTTFERVPTMGGEARVHPDWSFEINGLPEGRRITGSVAQNPDWAIKAVLHGGVDVTDTGIDFVPGQTVEGLTVVFTRKLTELSGRIEGERGKPETDATVVVFAEDPARWTFGTRYVRTTRPSQEGRYSLRGLPPHDYLVAVVKELEPGQWSDPEFLESLRAQASRITLHEGGNAVQDLKVVPR
jgi:hypothetical protein